MVALNQIQLAEKLSPCQMTVEVLHVGQWVPVQGGDDVEAVIVPAGPPTTVFLGHHMQQ